MAANGISDFGDHSRVRNPARYSNNSPPRSVETIVSDRGRLYSDQSFAFETRLIFVPWAFFAEFTLNPKHLETLVMVSTKGQREHGGVAAYLRYGEEGRCGFLPARMSVSHRFHSEVW